MSTTICPICKFPLDLRGKVILSVMFHIIIYIRFIIHHYEVISSSDCFTCIQLYILVSSFLSSMENKHAHNGWLFLWRPMSYKVMLIYTWNMGVCVYLMAIATVFDVISLQEFVKYVHCT